MKPGIRKVVGIALMTLVPVLSCAQVLRVGLAEDPDLLDPTQARTFVGRIVFSALCDKLVDIDENERIDQRILRGRVCPVFYRRWKLIARDDGGGIIWNS